MLKTLTTLAFLLVRWSRNSERLTKGTAIMNNRTIILKVLIPKIIQVLIPL
jgi:hypothetical protein